MKINQINSIKHTLAATFLIASFLLITSTAFAGGWHKIGTKEGNTSDTWDPNAGLWSSKSNNTASKIPHLGLSTSSNNCRTCHAVHNADNTTKGLGYDGNDADTLEDTGSGQNFKLLRNESRTTECFFCHGPEGALTSYKKKPYADMRQSGSASGTIKTAKGEHTLGALEIPDSTVDSSFLQATDGLTCGNCHSVHGGWTLNGVTQAGALNTRILKRDPAQNGNGDYKVDGSYALNAGDGAAGGVLNVQSQGNGNKPVETFKRSDEAIAGERIQEQLRENQVLAAFCGDCHNKNVNWDRGGVGSSGDEINDPDWPNNDPNLFPYNPGKPEASQGERPNKLGHPLGETEELVDVYGKLKIIAAKMWNGFLTCDVCHSSRTSSTSKFPHQSVSHKLLLETYTDTSSELDPTIDPINKPNNYKSWLKSWDEDFHPGKEDAYTGDPNRPIPNLQTQVCMTCHGAYVGLPDNPDSF